MGSPAIKTPFTKCTDSLGKVARATCADYQLDYVECASKVGSTRARVECFKFLEDLSECMNKATQHARVKAMREEQARQGRPYLDPPSDDLPMFERFRS